MNTREQESSTLVDALIARYGEFMTLSEVADVVKVPVGSLRAQVSRSRWPEDVVVRLGPRSPRFRTRRLAAHLDGGGR